MYKVILNGFISGNVKLKKNSHKISGIKTGTLQKSETKIFCSWLKVLRACLENSQYSAQKEKKHVAGIFE